MNPHILNLIYVVAGAFGLAYVAIPKFRANINQLVRVTWNRWFSTQVDPRDKAKDDGNQAIDKQKKALQAAIALVKQQKEAVVTLTATATTSSNELRRRQDAVNSTITDYNDGKSLGMSNADLDKLALKVKDARAAVSAQEANVKLAQANANTAAASLSKTTDKIKKFGQQILDNEDKLALADALNIQAAAENLTNSIDSMLSEAGEANKEIERILAEADARSKVGSDTTTDELERRRREKEAQDERDRLDGKTPTAPATPTAPSTPSAPSAPTMPLSSTQQYYENLERIHREKKAQDERDRLDGKTPASPSVPSTPSAPSAPTMPLSSTQQYYENLERILAEADARTKAGSDTTTGERDRLDGKTPASPTAPATPEAPAKQ